MAKANTNYPDPGETPPANALEPLRLDASTGQPDCWSALRGGKLMRDFSTPALGVPFPTEAATQHLDQMHERHLGEVRSHERSAVHWEGGAEPTVELTLDESRMMADWLNKASHLLRLASEGMLS